MSRTSDMLPRHFNDPLGVAWRAFRRGGPQGRFAVWTTLLGFAATPVDMALGSWERRLVREGEAPEQPIVLVCGPPRSGTTVVSQALIRTLEVAYLNNLMAVFPRSPLAASRLFGVRPRNHAVSTISHYGKTQSFHGPCDALFIWDRWLGADRTKPCTGLDPDAVRSMRAFFAAVERQHGRSVLNKNNNLNVHAHLVAEALPTARFICLEREPLFLAQSLLLARRHIHNNACVPYGVHHPDRVSDPYEDVARQVGFFRRSAAAEEERLGDRFWRVSYEDFCHRPWDLAQRVATEILDIEPDELALRRHLPALDHNNRPRLEPRELARLEECVETWAMTSTAEFQA